MNSVTYSQRCVCGATIKLVDTYEFIPIGNLLQQFADWQARHNECQRVFLRTQEEKIRYLECSAYTERMRRIR
jgi:hypothetical protein